jgi:hypothetical protein
MTPTKQGWTHTTARLLTANHDKIAPVSGCRCRSCGHNALRDDLDAMWYVRDMAAYCPPCAREEDATQLDTFKLWYADRSGYFGPFPNTADGRDALLAQHNHPGCKHVRRLVVLNDDWNTYMEVCDWIARYR